MEFEVKSHTYKERNLPVNVYINLSTNTVNPLELKEDIKMFIDYIKEKYSIKNNKLIFKEYILKLFKV